MQVREIIEQENHEVELDSPFGKIVVSAEKNMYTSLRKKYQELAKIASEQYGELYDKYTNCNDICEFGERDFKAAAEEAVENMKNDLISMGKYDYDLESIYKKLSELGGMQAFDNAYNKVTSCIYEIVGEYENNRQYREERKNSRGRYEVTTFGGGWLDAMTDQAEASIVNWGIGLAHSAVNAAGNKMDESSANNRLAELFGNPELKRTLVNGVYSSVFSFHYVLIELMKDCAGNVEWGVPISETIEKGKRMLNNLESGAIPASEESKVYQETFTGMCYGQDIYIHLMKKYGDKDGKIKRLSDYFGVSLEYAKDNVALAYVKEHQGETEEDAVKAKEELINYCKDIQLEVSDELECMKYINKRLEEFDIQYRTVENIVCMTRESADQSRGELPEIHEFMKDVRAPLDDDLLDYEENLKVKKEEFSAKFKSEIAAEYIKKMDGYLIKFDEQFCNVGLFKTVGRQEAGACRALKFVKKLNYKTIDDINAAYSLLDEFLPKVGITKDEAQDATNYIEKQRQKVEKGKTGGLFGGLFGKK